MKKELMKWLKELNINKGGDRQWAVVVLSDAMDRHAGLCCGSISYPPNWKPKTELEILSTRLGDLMTRQDHEAIAKAFGAMILTKDVTRALLWGLGHGFASLCFDPIVNVLKKSNHFDYDEITRGLESLYMIIGTALSRRAQISRYKSAREVECVLNERRLVRQMLRKRRQELLNLLVEIKRNHQTILKKSATVPQDLQERNLKLMDKCIHVIKSI